MKKITLLSIGILIMFGTLAHAKHIDENTAKKVGKTFLETTVNLQIVSSDFRLAYKSHSNDHQQTTFFYVFNVGTTGFVIVAADDNVTPILGYSDEGIFDPDHIPQNVKKWIEEYKTQIRYVIDNEIPATEEIQEKWISYIKKGNQSSVKSAMGTSSVSPLVQTKWNQSTYYNDSCPFDSQYNQRTVTGCVATAMAQIMKYWNYPATGTGFHSYNHQSYGTLSANFGSTTYQWSSMPNIVNSSNNAVATLMYHCGVSVDMNYGVAETGGSGAFIISTQSPIQHCSEYAFKTYFGYQTTLQGVERINYNQNQWINLLKTELDNSRPVLYAGFGSGGGHAFVCDGYDNNNFFHFNWGWGGAYDGYFSVNALNPDGLGIGGGTGEYNSGHQAVIGIEPPTGPQTYDIKLFDYVTPSSTNISYGDPFSIETNIGNYGTGDFNGDYSVAIFDSQYNFVDYMEIKTGYSLEAGYAYMDNLVFSNSGLLSMSPGTYYAAVFYRPTGGNWTLVADNGSYTNLAELNVLYYNDIELYSDINVTPGTILTQGEPVSVNLNIANFGTATFLGEYTVALYNLDGTWAQTIEIIDESSGLPSGYAYQAPYLTFSNNSVTVEPGTYLLALQHNLNNTEWQLTGSSYYQNPIQVIVQAPSLSADQYEVNNTLSQAYTLPVTYSGNVATTNTIGSNFHIGTDNDYYKINLSSGYDYTITARLHDSYNSGNGNIYSVDALFSYSIDGFTWSDTYDDIMSGNISIQNGGTVYFHIAPYFTGETGTYLLDIEINRTQALNIKNNDISSSVKVYPNPAKDFVIVDLNQYIEKADFISLVNIQGQQINAISIGDNKTIQIPLQGYSSGVYFIQIHSTQGGGILTEKIIIN